MLSRAVSLLSRMAKLIAAIRNNPKDVRFDDACKVAVRLGFVSSGGKGSHRTYARPGEISQLNFQETDGKVKPYHARQLIEMIDKYESEV